MSLTDNHFVKDKDYILSLIEQGEHEQQDFKYQISDARKIARSISAFANRLGGHLLVGVKDNGQIAGVSSDEEIYMVEQAAQMYCQPPQQVKFTIYRVNGKNVLKADIAEATVKPVKAVDEGGKWKAFYRVADENILASAVHMRALKERSKGDDQPLMLTYTDREKALLDYLAEHGGIGVGGLMKLTHCSRRVAETTIVKLYDLQLVDIEYHDGRCLVVEKTT